MNSRQPHFQRFIHRLHRRLVVLRALERVGIAILIGSAVAVVLMSILIARRECAVQAAGVIMGLSLAAGLMWGVSRRPTVLNAAMEADRQLRLFDLLSTAWTMRSAGSSDPWADAVLVEAEARCQKISAADVILNRLGARAWGGVGLAGALVLTLALISVNPPATMAEDRAGDGAQSSSRRDSNRKVHVFTNAQPPRQGPGIEPNQDRKIGETPTEQQAGQGASQNKSAKQKDPNDPSASSAGGGGAGIAQTPSRGADPHAPVAGGADQSAPKGKEGAGGGGAGRDGGSAGPSGTNTDAARSPMSSAPWSTQEWNADRKRALDAIESNRVPGRYSDIIRGYFERER